MRPPLPGPIVRAQLDGAQVTPREPESVTLRSVPAELTIDCG